MKYKVSSYLLHPEILLAKIQITTLSPPTIFKETDIDSKATNEDSLLLW